MKNIIKVRITKCGSGSWWYDCEVGNTYEVINDSENNYDYTVRLENIYGGYKIRREDCVEIDSSEHSAIESTVSQPTHESILLEANKVVNGDRNEQYGDAKEAFTIYSEICKSAFGLELSPDEICKVLMAVKLGRLKYKYKRDSIVDLCGYAEILSKLMEE
jgi:hypothetical protein